MEGLEFKDIDKLTMGEMESYPHVAGITGVHVFEGHSVPESPDDIRAGIKEAVADGLVYGNVEGFLIDFKNKYFGVSAELFHRVKEEGVFEVRIRTEDGDMLKFEFPILGGVY